MSNLNGIPCHRWLRLLLLALCFFVLVGCEHETNTNVAESQSACPDNSFPWDIDWLPTESKSVINRIDAILEGSGLTGQGTTILEASRQYGVNPAFALAMFRKEASFGAFDTRAFRNNNPGNIIATSDCRGMPAGSSCSGYYGEISTDGRFGVYSSRADGVKAYFILLANEYRPGSRRNCEDVSCIISAYCPAAECDVETYISQITEWTKQYQCQMVGLQQPIILAPQPSVPAIAVTVVSDTIPLTDRWFDTLAGEWEGEVYSSSLAPSGEGPYQWKALIEEGPSRNLILTLTEESISYVLEKGGPRTPLNDSSQQYYCFYVYDSGGSGMQVGDRCFRLLNADELDYVGGDLIGNTWGTFTRVGNTQPVSDAALPDLWGRVEAVVLFDDSLLYFSTMEFDKEVVERICELINCEPSFVVVTDWSVAIDSVLGGRYDWLGTASTITKDREAALDYAIPFYILGGNELQSFAFPSGSDLVEPVSKALRLMLDNEEISLLIDKWNVPYAGVP